MPRCSRINSRCCVLLSRIVFTCFCIDNRTCTLTTFDSAVPAMYPCCCARCFCHLNIPLILSATVQIVVSNFRTHAMLAVVQHTGSYEATCMFVRNSEAAQLKSEINDGTYEHKFSFFLSFVCVCVCVKILQIWLRNET